MFTSISQQCATVIPCLNAEGTISALVTGAARHVPMVVVVDDGSTDDTSAEARHAGAMVIRLARSGGKGTALREGFRRARELGCFWAVALDGDGQHAPEEIPTF